MTTIPRPDLEQAIASLSERDEWRVITRFIRDERDRAFADFASLDTPEKVMANAGRVGAFDDVLFLFDKQ